MVEYYGNMIDRIYAGHNNGNGTIQDYVDQHGYDDAVSEYGKSDVFEETGSRE